MQVEDMHLHACAGLYITCCIRLQIAFVRINENFVVARLASYTKLQAMKGVREFSILCSLHFTTCSKAAKILYMIMLGRNQTRYPRGIFTVQWELSSRHLSPLPAACLLPAQQAAASYAKRGS